MVRAGEYGEAPRGVRRPAASAPGLGSGGAGVGALVARLAADAPRSLSYPLARHLGVVLGLRGRVVRAEQVRLQAVFTLAARDGKGARTVRRERLRAKDFLEEVWAVVAAEMPADHQPRERLVLQARAREQPECMLGLRTRRPTPRSRRGHGEGGHSLSRPSVRESCSRSGVPRALSDGQGA